MTLIKKKITFDQNETTKVEINVRPFTDEKNKGIRGFVDVGVLRDGKYAQGYNALQVVETSEGNLVIIEPKQKAYKDKDGNFKSQAYYVLAKAIKEDLVKHILAEAIAKA